MAPMVVVEYTIAKRLGVVIVMLISATISTLALGGGGGNDECENCIAQQNKKEHEQPKHQAAISSFAIFSADEVEPQPSNGQQEEEDSDHQERLV